jgi:phosphoenolpyruvate carboxykinase (ATP)
MKISYTRAMVQAALSGDLDAVSYTEDAIFGVMVPDTCPNVPNEVLKPRNTWTDKAAYDETAKKLAGMFQKNFEQFKAGATDEIIAAGPRA